MQKSRDFSVFIVDNYDSFTFNLVHYLDPFVSEVVVQRNDAIDWSIVDRCDAIVLSPGPGLPSEAPNLFDVIRKYTGKKPILGVCLGMQALAEVAGGELRNQQHVKHGKQEKIEVIEKSILFENIPTSFHVGLYHSWEVVEATLPSTFVATAISENNVLMAIEDSVNMLYGVQFHPESILSDYGKEVLRNFLDKGKK